MVDLSDEEPPAAPHAILTSIRETRTVPQKIQQLRARYRPSAVVAVASHSDASAVVAAFRAGADDAVLHDPGGDLEDLVATIKLAIERRRIAEATASTSDEFVQELGRRARSLSRAYDSVESAYEETLEALVRALDVREKATAGHSIRVAYFTCWLAKVMGIHDDELNRMYRGAILHDIGKIGIPDAILLKPGKLTAEEFRVMETHTSLAKAFLQNIGYLADAIAIPYSHHEKWNGAGYPRGLAREEIPIDARIFAVADVYDALRSERCYKPAFSHDKSVAIITEDSGSHFDPSVVDAFLKQPLEVWTELDSASRTRGAGFALMCEAFAEIPDRVPALAGAPQ